MGKEKKDEPQELKTAPFDPRYPNANQARSCYQNYIDYLRCQKIRGDADASCEFFKKCYRSLCPNEWVERWDAQRADGTFPRNID